MGGSGVVNEFESPELDRLVVVRTVDAGVTLPLLPLEPPLVGLISALNNATTNQQLDYKIKF